MKRIIISKTESNHEDPVAAVPVVVQFSPSLYSAKRTKHAVSFFCRALQARQVFLVGDFNEWSPTFNPMNRTPTGTWTLCLMLHHGHHQYYFLVDGRPTLDPNALGAAKNQRDEPVSLVAVS